MNTCRNYTLRRMSVFARTFSAFSAKLHSLSQNRIGRYAAGIYNDYRTVLIEAAQDAWSRPGKATSYFTILLLTGYVIKKNPSETEFYNRLMDSANDLATVGEPIRNRNSNAHIQHLRSCAIAGQLRRFSFGICSVMWVDNFDPCVDVYSARCKQLQVGWLDWHERIVDFGVLGHWHKIERAMIDYDVNPDEWTESQNNI